MPISKELVQAVRAGIAAQPELAFNRLAETLNVTEAEVIIALPVAMRRKARITAFDAIWNTVSTWNAPISVFQGKDRCFLGQMRGDDLTLPRKKTSGKGEQSLKAMPLREELGVIWFISRPCPEGESYSISFLDKQGHHLLSVTLAEDAYGRPYYGQLSDFEDMKKRFGVVPTPKNRCKGCKGCICDRQPAIVESGAVSGA